MPKWTYRGIGISGLPAQKDSACVKCGCPVGAYAILVALYYPDNSCKDFITELAGHSIGELRKRGLTYRIDYGEFIFMKPGVTPNDFGRIDG